jgi:hypothetical protein
MNRDHNGAVEGVFNLFAKRCQQFPVFGYTFLPNRIRRCVPFGQFTLGFGIVPADLAEHDVSQCEFVNRMSSFRKSQPDRSHVFIHCPLPPSKRHSDAECPEGIFSDQGQFVQYVTVRYGSAIGDRDQRMPPLPAARLVDTGKMLTRSGNWR